MFGCCKFLVIVWEVVAVGGVVVEVVVSLFMIASFLLLLLGRLWLMLKTLWLPLYGRLLLKRLWCFSRVHLTQ